MELPNELKDVLISIQTDMVNDISTDINKRLSEYRENICEQISQHIPVGYYIECVNGFSILRSPDGERIAIDSITGEWTPTTVILDLISNLQYSYNLLQLVIDKVDEPLVNNKIFGKKIG